MFRTKRYPGFGIYTPFPKFETRAPFHSALGLALSTECWLGHDRLCCTRTPRNRTRILRFKDLLLRTIFDDASGYACIAAREALVYLGSAPYFTFSGLFCCILKLRFNRFLIPFCCYFRLGHPIRAHFGLCIGGVSSDCFFLFGHGPKLRPWPARLFTSQIGHCIWF